MDISNNNNPAGVACSTPNNNAGLPDCSGLSSPTATCPEGPDWGNLQNEGGKHTDARDDCECGIQGNKEQPSCWGNVARPLDGNNGDALTLQTAGWHLLVEFGACSGTSCRQI